MADLGVADLVGKLPHDQAHMLRVISEKEEGFTTLKDLYWAVSRVVDTEEWCELKVWHWRKNQGREVAQESPHDPRKDFKALSRARKSDLIPFALLNSIPIKLRKEEMLAQLRPFLDEHPVFYQVLFSLVSKGLLVVEASEVDGQPPKTILHAKILGDLDSVRKALSRRWEDDHTFLRNLLNRFLIGAFELEGTDLGSAILETDRRASVEELYASLAVADTPIPVPGGVTTSAYHAVLWILSSIELSKGERVLVCGAKGCMTAAMAKRLVGPEGEVRVLEWHEETAAWAKEAAGRHGFSEADLAVIQQDDVTEGTGEKGYWNAIIVNGSVPKIPYPLLDQLDDESGRLLFFVSSPSENASKCWVIKKNDEVLDVEALSNFRFTPIYGKYGWDLMEDLQENYDNIRRGRERRPERDKIGRLLNTAPYPVAKALGVADTAVDASDQHTKALSLFELLIKLYAFIAIQGMDRDQCMPEKTVEGLSPLYRRPSTGHWLPILRDACRVKEESIPCSRLDGILQAKIKSRAVLDCYRMLQVRCGKENAGRKKSVKLVDFLTKVVNYRNVSNDATHGSPLGKGLKLENAELLRSAFVSLLRADCIPSDWRFSFIKSNSTLAGGKIVYERINLSGSDFRRERDQIKGDTPLPSRIVYLEMKGLESPLIMTPWLTLGEGKFGQDELFVFKQEGKYTTYHNEDYYPADAEQRMLEDLLKRHPSKTKKLDDMGSGAIVFKEMLGVFVRDGILQRNEVSDLLSLMTKYGLAVTEGEAEEDLIAIVQKDHPEVYIEPSE